MALVWGILALVDMEQYSYIKVTGRNYQGAIVKPPIIEWN